MRSAISLIAACALWAGLAPVVADADPAWPLTPLASATGGNWPPAPWQINGLPAGSRGAIPLTRFEAALDGGHPVVDIYAQASYGTLAHPLQPPQAVADGARISWRWQIVQPIAGANLRTKAGDDAPIKLCVALDVPRQRLSWFNRSLLALAESRTGTALPTATLCYLWDAQLPVGSTGPNAYTDRVRWLVVASGADAVGRWQSFERDLAADVRTAFGAEAQPLPAATAIVIGADADNTGQQGRAMLAALRVWKARVP